MRLVPLITRTAIVAALLGSVTTSVTAQPVQEAKLLPADAAQGDYFGSDVSLWGDRALIGAHSNDSGGVNSGAAYVFVRPVFARPSDEWLQEAKLTPIDRSAGDAFGGAVSLWGDRALVGAVASGPSDVGAAYVFVRSGSTWVQEAKLTPTDGSAGDAFGVAVSLSGDRAIVGAFYDDAGGSVNNGSAYVFVRSGNTWVQEAKLTANDGSASDVFGSAVSLSGDRAIVGAYSNDAGGSVNSGSAYVFVRSGSTWVQEAKLTASDGRADDLFGVSVSISGGRALVGSPSHDSSEFDSGSAYVFVRSGSTWVQEAKLLASGGGRSDFFGASVSLSDDAALVGATGIGPPVDGGAGYVFVRSVNTWTQVTDFVPDDQGGRFGASVSISGQYALFGAPNHAGPQGSNSGSAYVFAGVRVVASESSPLAGVAVFALSPNPASSQATLTLTVDYPQVVRAVVLDVLGRELAVSFEGFVTGTNQIAVNASGLVPGVYVVRVEGESFAQVRRFTVVR